MKLYTVLAASLTVLMFANPAVGELNPTRESLSGMYPGKAYSPYAQRAFPGTPLWGDTHLHTGLSVDAGLFGARLGLEEAYQFARGEEVISSTGQPVKLSRPLDWLVIADHSDAMGFFQRPRRRRTGHPSSSSRANAGTRGCSRVETPRSAAALDLIATFSQGKIPGNDGRILPGRKYLHSIWEHVVEPLSASTTPGNSPP